MNCINFNENYTDNNDNNVFKAGYICSHPTTADSIAFLTIFYNLKHKGHDNTELNEGAWSFLNMLNIKPKQHITNSSSGTDNP